MELKQVDELLHKLNFCTSYQGYPTTVYLIGLAVENIDITPRPTLIALCKITGDYFHIKSDSVSDNLKTMLNNYSSQDKNLALFEKVIGYRADGKLTNKEFLYEVATFLSNQK